MPKSFHFASAALVAVFGSLAAFQWGDFVSPTTAAEIVRDRRGLACTCASGPVFLAIAPSAKTWRRAGNRRAGSKGA